MRERFLGFYRPSEDELSRLWDTCVFVLDANVLLNLYRYPKKAHDDLLRVLKKIADRLWVPHQAALEYQQNRLAVIAEQVKRYDEAGKALEDIDGQLRGNLGQLQLKKRHSSINPDPFLEKVRAAFDEFLGELKKLRQEQPDVYDEDKLRDEIDSLLKGRVGAPPESQGELDKIYEEGQKRYGYRCPPGYMDAEKSNNSEIEAYSYGGLCFRREYGDLILWYETMKEAQSREEFKNIIFITDDDKEDWWWTVESRGKKTIGPRPELVEEIRSKAGVQLFYMYNSEQFMQLAEKHLGVQVEQESIKQVRNIAQLRKEEGGRVESIVELHRAALDAVLDWLKSSYPDDSIIQNEKGFPDFIRVSHQDGLKHGYEVKMARTAYHVPMRAREALYRGYYETTEGALNTFTLLMMIEGEQDVTTMRQARKAIQRLDIPPNVRIELFGLAVDAESAPSLQFMYGVP